MSEYIPLVCEHHNAILTRRTYSNGVVHAIHQCLRCGESVGGSVARAKLPKPIDALLPWDENLRTQWRHQREAHYKRWRGQKEAEQQAQSSQWWAQYNAYLNSPEWRAKRAAVMNRAGGLCEGCRDARATQVHHLTYTHAGHSFAGGEFLWELVAVCDECHDRIHERDARGMEVAA